MSLKCRMFASSVWQRRNQSRESNTLSLCQRPWIHLNYTMKKHSFLTVDCQGSSQLKILLFQAIIFISACFLFNFLDAPNIKYFLVTPNMTVSPDAKLAKYIYVRVLRVIMYFAVYWCEKHNLRTETWSFTYHRLSIIQLLQSIV